MSKPKLFVITSYRLITSYHLRPGKLDDGPPAAEIFLEHVVAPTEQEALGKANFPTSEISEWRAINVREVEVPGHMILLGPGDELSFKAGDRVRVITDGPPGEGVFTVRAIWTRRTDDTGNLGLVVTLREVEGEFLASHLQLVEEAG